MRLLVLALSCALVPSPLFAADPTPEAIEFFEKKVRPVLVEHCQSCHGEKKQQAGLRLDTADAMAKGADDGPVVVPGDPAKSRLVKAVQRAGDFPMPPKKALPPEAVAALTEWVKIGAPFPQARAGVTQVNDGKAHWAFRPVREPQVPSTKAQVKNPIDAFILAKLAEKGLQPAPKADKRTLLRRAYFDLIGIPPTYDEVQAFEKDTAPDAFEKVIDQLLASPHYGERWARHWLDLARYADSKGYVFQESRAYPFAYTYRDYVIRSFNEDKPYDRFIVEQLAADKLPLGDDKRALAAMGFLTVGRRFMNNMHDVIDDRIDVVTRGLMGLTVSCARCHDHKYDPIPAADYYSLYGVFASSMEPKELPLLGGERTADSDRFDAEVAKRQEGVDAEKARRVTVKAGLFAGVLSAAGAAAANPDRLLNREDRNKLTDLQKKVDEYKATSPFAPPRAMVMRDNPRLSEPVVFLRGNPQNRGPSVPRQAPAVIAPARKPFTDGSGRLDLARAIASPDNPLTARVLVNRVWGHHFGRPLVRTPSDFGLRSEPPSHPELLDWLAKRFVEDGWSVKKLHKRMMLSTTYQQASVTPSPADPENLLLGSMNRRRFDFEALRDGLLATSGKLDRTMYGRSVDLFAKPYPARRAVYGSVDRQNLPGTFRVFDFASPDQHSPQRFLTTVPQQALYLMNSPFVAEQAKATAARTEGLKGDERTRRLYQVVLARNPTANELALAKEFVASAETAKPAAGQLGEWELLAQVLLLSNEFAFVD